MHPELCSAGPVIRVVIVLLLAVFLVCSLFEGQSFFSCIMLFVKCMLYDRCIASTQLVGTQVDQRFERPFRARCGRASPLLVTQRQFILASGSKLSKDSLCRHLNSHSSLPVLWGWLFQVYGYSCAHCSWWPSAC